MSKLSILDWMDDILKEYLEYEEIAAAEDPQFFKLYAAINKWNKNNFAHEADEEGLAKFEQLLGIVPHKTESLEDRRARVIAKLNTRLPYTEIQLRRLLGGILGYDGFTLTVKDLILTLSLAEGNNSRLQIILDILGEIVPMNILIVIHQLITKRIDVYFGGIVRVGNRLRIHPFYVSEIMNNGSIYYGGCVKIGNTIRIKPNTD